MENTKVKEEKMNIPRIMIAAPASASGKTSVTIALLKNLKDAGLNPVSVKAGPDYIDPLFHRTVTGVEAFNLDTFFTDDDTTVKLFETDAKGHGIAVLEGVMGLYDGIGGVKEEGSSYALAKVTKTPVILVVNAKGAGRSLAALIAGMKAFDSEELIRGVILNRISEKFYEIIKPVIEEETGVKVLGFLPERKDVMLSSRHLGLVTPDEVKELKQITERLADELKENADLDEMIKIANSAPDLPEEGSVRSESSEGSDCNDALWQDDFRQNVSQNGKTCTIAISKDEAFQFFYEENVRMLQKLGAEIVFFSPLHDKEVPKEADAVILCGGYPELYLDKISSNTGMAESIRSCYGKGMPLIAECGGFIYLHKTIYDRDGKAYPGAGIIDSTCSYTGKSVRFGYISIKEKKPDFLKENSVIKGHEFHYYESDHNGNDCVAVKPFGGQNYECIQANPVSWLGFAHLYYPSNPDFARSIVKKASLFHLNRFSFF